MVWLLRSLRLTTCLERVLDWAVRGSQKGRSDCTRLVQHLLLKYIVAWVCSWDLSLDSNQLTATVTASSQGISVLKAKRGPHIQLQCALQTLFTPKIACPFLSPFDPGVLPFQGFTWAPLGLPPTLQRNGGKIWQTKKSSRVKSLNATLQILFSSRSYSSTARTLKPPPGFEEFHLAASVPRSSQLGENNSIYIYVTNKNVLEE